MQYFNYNGKMLAQDIKPVDHDNRGLRYGDGLFETMKYTANGVVHADEHFARLWKGMEVLQFKVPVHLGPEKLEQEILQLIKKNAQEFPVRVRLMVFSGKGGLYDNISHSPNYLIETWPLSKDSGQWNSNGLVLHIYEKAKKSCDILSNLKHNNFLPYVLAALDAKKQKCNDAVLLNSHGRICDSTIANIFIVKDGIVFTPPLSEGCIAGVTRHMLIRQLASSVNVVQEKEISIEQLLDADEVFLTNSIYNIRWVQSIGDKEYHYTKTREIFSAVKATFA